MLLTLSYLVPSMCDAWQRDDDRLPGVQFTKDVAACLLNRWVQVHHLVRYAKLVNEFLESQLQLVI